MRNIEEVNVIDKKYMLIQNDEVFLCSDDFGELARMALKADNETKPIKIVDHYGDDYVLYDNRDKELKSIFERFYQVGGTNLYDKGGSFYFDMDGTLARWYEDGRGLTYPEEILDPKYHYYLNLEPHPMTIALAKRLQDMGYDVCIISCADESCIMDKYRWLKTLCPFIKAENMFFAPIGADKTDYVKRNADKSVLVDDYNKNLSEWKEHGGASVKLVNSVNSVNSKYLCLKVLNDRRATDHDIEEFVDSAVIYMSEYFSDKVCKKTLSSLKHDKHRKNNKDMS